MIEDTPVTIRKAVSGDVEEILEIFRYARKFMAEQGNPTQWTKHYPNRELVEKDIQSGNCYICEHGDETAGVFTFVVGEEANYRVIEEGSWNSDSVYGTIHRLAGNGRAKGVAKACFDFCKGRADYLRVDTHRDNWPMQRAVQKAGFLRCGIIRVEDQTMRIAYDWMRKKAEEKI